MSSSTTPNADNAATPKAAPSAVEFEPPLACVRRILKQTLPSSTHCGKDASQAFTRACGIFVIYVTACANDIAREHKRTTITANDVLAAMKELDFDEFTPELQDFLAVYRATEKQKKEAKAAAKAAEADAASKGGEETTTPPPKKAPEAPTSGGATSSVAEHEETEGDDDDKTQGTQETNEAAEDKGESKEDDDDKEAEEEDKKPAATTEPEPMEE